MFEVKNGDTDMNVFMKVYIFVGLIVSVCS